MESAENCNGAKYHLLANVLGLGIAESCGRSNCADNVIRIVDACFPVHKREQRWS